MEEYRYRMVDTDSEFGPRGIMQEWRVIRETPKGAWIAPPWTSTYNPEEKTLTEWKWHYGAKFVLNDSRRCFAHPTKELAVNSFRIRKMRQIQHCRNAIDRAKEALEWLENGEEAKPSPFPWSAMELHA